MKRSSGAGLIAAITFAFFLPFLSGKALSAHGQIGNSIDGYVVGANREPVSDLNVELLDNLGRTYGHARTDARGYYSFRGMPSGTYRIHVYTYGTDYEEAEGATELSSFSRNRPDGGISRSSDMQEVSFTLKLRRGLTPEAVAIFVQDIPREAQKLYDKALADFAAKRNAAAIAGLKSAIEIFPKYYYALERLGIEYVQMGKPEGYEAAAILLGMAVEVNPRGFKSWYNLAYSRYMLKAYSDGLTAAKKAAEINGESPQAAALEGTLLRVTKKAAEAEKRLLRAIELSRDTIPQAHYQLALLYGNDMKRYAEAAKELRLYLKGQPNAADKAGIEELIAKFEAKAAEKS
jgi:tetratricopeptide (TPR) repeat protein